MTLGAQRLEHQLQKIESIISQNKQAKDLALSLYQSDLRTPFFMIQGLCRLYRKIHNGKRFEKYLEQSKLIEDLLGQLDFHIALQQVVVHDNKLNKICSPLIADKIEEAKNNLIYALEDKGWLNGKRISKWRKKLAKLKWIDDAVKEQQELKSVYMQEIDKAKHFINTLPHPIDDMELQVHELRRKLRWLSIYVHALGNAFQFDETQPDSVSLNHNFFTEELRNSPFNQIPTKNSIQQPILINKFSFWTLSYFIAAIGSIKDKGLFDEAILNLIKEHNNFSDKKLVTNTLQKSLENSYHIALKQSDELILQLKKFAPLTALVM